MSVIRCIFCKADSSESRSREHIFPESLGNEEHLLPRGVVCDACNNYFARKVEKPVLDSPVLRDIRAGMVIPNKKGRIPNKVDALGRPLPGYRAMGRFLGKVGFEIAASRALEVPDWNSELVDNPGFDELRDYVRYDRGADWPYSFRTLYPIDAVFDDGVKFQVLHECEILYTTGKELYAAIALFGVEFALNLGGRLLDGYMRWLDEHVGKSPLYPEDVPPWR